MQAGPLCFTQYTWQAVIKLAAQELASLRTSEGAGLEHAEQQADDIEPRCTVYGRRGRRDRAPGGQASRSAPEPGAAGWQARWKPHEAGAPCQEQESQPPWGPQVQPEEH